MNQLTGKELKKKMNTLFKLIEEYKLEDELHEIYPYNKECYIRKKLIFKDFVNKIIGENNSIYSELEKLFYFYSQALELIEIFMEESPTEADGIFIIKNVLINNISNAFFKVDSLEKVKILLSKKGIDLDKLLKEPYDENY